MSIGEWVIVDCAPNGVGEPLKPGTKLPVLWRGSSEDAAVDFLYTLNKADVEAGRYGIDGPV